MTLHFSLFDPKAENTSPPSRRLNFYIPGLIFVFIGILSKVYYYSNDKETNSFTTLMYLFGAIFILMNRFSKPFTFEETKGAFEGYIRFDYEGFEWNGVWYSKRDFAMVSYAIDDYSGKTIGGNSYKITLSSGTSNYFTFTTAEATHQLQFRIPSENYLYPLKEVLQSYIP